MSFEGGRELQNNQPDDGARRLRRDLREELEALETAHSFAWWRLESIKHEVEKAKEAGDNAKIAQLKAEAISQDHILDATQERIFKIEDELGKAER